MREFVNVFFDVTTDFNYGLFWGVFGTFLIAGLCALIITIIFSISDFIDEYKQLKNDVKKLKKKCDKK